VNFGVNAPLVAKRFEFLAVTGEDDGSDLPPEIISIIEKPASDQAEYERQAVVAYFVEHAEATQRQRVELANLEERLRVLTEKFPTMVMDQAEQAARHVYLWSEATTRRRRRRFRPGRPPRCRRCPLMRLGIGLAWLSGSTAPNHPLTARVAVNRFWQTLFGTGIVKTTADFGAQGEWPSHPELLDWLAVDFVESGWDVKALVRKIVTSATYRQTSAASDDLIARDPANQLLARGPRFRLPAEFIRDAALKSSGLLVDRIGGPSVNPYTPGDLWREISHYGSSPATSQAFMQDHGEKLYRRSLYTYWKRTVPPPNMAAFDAPNREICTVQRASTTTPLQALVLLNDVQFVEAGRALAERMMQARRRRRSEAAVGL
jgi:hypothetical protein